MSMVQSLPYLKETASQTAGPYVHIGLAPGVAGFDIYERELGQDIAGPDAPGTRIRIEGLVLDGAGAPVKDVLIEAWQADAAGIYPHRDDPLHAHAAPGFRGWGRIITDFNTGIWGFDTIKPGATPGRMGRVQAPHISLWLVARGINIGLHTRLYFADEAQANAADPVLNLIEQENRRKTLLAASTMREGVPVYRFDIRLQGEGETVFLDI
jgi:protocatechuate 3,4-dioxygenase alpha subunit